jgi:hypothetical protein
LPLETIACRKNGGESTIVLVFSSSYLSYTLIACCLREDLDHGSDHFPIETAILFSPLVPLFVLKPQWRKADKVVLVVRAGELDLMLRNYKHCKDIDEGVEWLVRWIKETVTQHIPLSKPVFFFVPWWSKELTQLV